MKYTWFPLRNYHLFKNIKKIEHAFLPEVRRIAYCFKYTKKKAYRHVRKLVLDRTRQQGDVQRRECVHAINWKNYK
jgi:hypothetical protein